jgi:uroporphyrinogen-III synthase
MAQLKLAPDALSQAKIALYGAKTRITANALFPSWGAARILEGSHEKAIAALQLNDSDVVVIPVAQRTRSDWAAAIRTSGAQAQIVPAYRLLLGRGGDDLPGMLWGGLVDAIIFFTENSVRHFVIRLKAEGGTLDMLGDVVVASMDEQTATAAAAYGLHTQLLPPKPDYASLAETVAYYFSAEPVQP